MLRLAMAMGPARRDVRLLILRQHVTPALIGITVGLAGAFALSRFLTALLYGVRAVRAVRVDPLVALRAD